MEVFGATPDDFAKVKVKNARHGLHNPNARYRKEVTLDDDQRGADRRRPAAAARDLRDVATARRPSSCRAWTTRSRAASGNPVRIAAISTVTPSYPNTVIEMPHVRDRLRVRRRGARSATFRDSIAAAAYEQSGLGPDDLDLAEVYDLSTALELDWYENIGLCKPGEAERLLNDGDTTIGGRVPVNASGGLACFGEAVPAQALAQVCEITWHLQGKAGERQVEGAPGRAHGEPGPLRPRKLRDPSPLVVGAVTTPTQWNLADLFEAVADAVPDRTAIVVGDRRLTFREVDERADAARAPPRGAGVSRRATTSASTSTTGRSRSRRCSRRTSCVRSRSTSTTATSRPSSTYLFDNADLVGLVHGREFVPRIAAVQGRRARSSWRSSRSRTAPSEDLATIGAVEYEAALAAASPDRDFPPAIRGRPLHPLHRRHHRDAQGRHVDAEGLLPLDDRPAARAERRHARRRPADVVEAAVSGGGDRRRSRSRRSCTAPRCGSR